MTDMVDHLLHCLEDLRAAVVCRSDMTLERFDVEKKTEPWFPQWGPSGSGNTHSCRDWHALVDYVARNGVIKSAHGWIRTH